MIAVTVHFFYGKVLKSNIFILLCSLQNKAQLVVIAYDVDPKELVVWLPDLCRKREVPYCIVKGKSCLGSVSSCLSRYLFVSIYCRLFTGRLPLSCA